jgi:NADH-quinone oxidoreductase subunit J
MNMTLNFILLSCLLLAAIWTVMTIRLIRSIVGLAITSMILSVIMYRLNSPLAAVFELSVCAGLISVIFIITVSFTERTSKEQLPARRKERFARFWLLPFILVAVALLLYHYLNIPKIELPLLLDGQNVRNLIWNTRHLDLLGQVIVLLTGAFGVAVLFKESKK